MVSDADKDELMSLIRDLQLHVEQLQGRCDAYALVLGELAALHPEVHIFLCDQANTLEDAQMLSETVAELDQLRVYSAGARERQSLAEPLRD